jgi:hypothetical protein
MTETSHRLFRLLGQLPAGIVAEDRDELFLGTDGFDGQDALRRIGLAVERSNRLDLLSPIRDHARSHHAPRPPDDTAWPKRYLDLARSGETIGNAAGAGVVTRLEPEFSNIVAAIRAVLATGRRDEAMAALKGFGCLTYFASLPAPVLSDLAESCRTAGDVQGEANCIQSLGDIALTRSDHDAARKAYEDALPLYRKVGDVLGEANCIAELERLRGH